MVTVKRRRTGIIVAASLAVAALVVTGGLTGVRSAYAGRILPGVTVNGVKVGGLTPTKAAARLEQSGLSQIELTIKDEVIEVDPATVGINFDHQAVAEAALAVGRTGPWWRQAADTAVALVKPPTVAHPPTIDEEQMNWFVNDAVTDFIVEPTDATLQVKGEAVTIVPGADGLAVNLDRLKSDLMAAVSGGAGTVRITVVTQAVPPAVTEVELQPFKERIERLAAVPVTLTADNNPLSTSQTQRLTWFKLEQDKSGGLILTLDTAAVTATVTALTKNYSWPATTEQVDTSGAVLAPGSDGQQVEVATVVNEIQRQLAPALAGRSDQTPTAVASAVPLVAIPKKIVTVSSLNDGVTPAIQTDAKFIQIDLGRQKMYVFEGQNLVNVFAISTGKKGWETPRGVHKIYNKDRRPFSKTYGLYLPYWMALTADGEFGIHELPEWPDGRKEGENHLGVPVSHGCIRLGIGAAAYMYEWAPLGTAVVVQ